MVDEDEPAFEVKARYREADDAARRRMYRRPIGDRHVDAIVRRARLAVKDALAAEDAADRPVGGPDELLREPIAIRVGLARRRLAHRLFMDAREFFRRRIDLLRGQTVDRLNVPLPRRDVDRLAQGLCVAGRRDFECGFCRRFAIEAEDEFTRRRNHDGLAVERERRAGNCLADDQPTLFGAALKVEDRFPVPADDVAELRPAYTRRRWWRRRLRR